MESISKSNDRGLALSAILSIIGGALMAAGGLLAISMFGVWSQAGMPGWSGGMMGGWSMMGQGAGFMSAAMGILAAIWIGTGVVSMAGGYSIYNKPETVQKWGIGILVASIIGLVTMSGFFIGPILGIIGGILALTKK